MKRALHAGSVRTAACRAYLRANGDRVAFVDLYTVTLARLGTVDTATGIVTGLVLRWAGAEYDVPFEGVLYAGGGLARGPKVTREEVRWAIGVEVTELALTLALDGTDRLPPADGNPATAQLGLGEALAGGLFDGARVDLRRLIMPAHPTYPIHIDSIADRGDLLPGDTSLGAVHIFRGRITGDSSLSRSAAKLIVKGHTEALDVQMPRNIYQAGCLWTLYDLGCGLSRTGSFNGEDFQHLGTIVAATRDTFTLAAAPPAPAGFYDAGTLQFSTGVLCGLALSIESASGATVVTKFRAPRPPTVGDAVVLQAGCDKVGLVRNPSTGNISGGTCATKFGNLARFRGMPHVPEPSTAY